MLQTPRLIFYISATILQAIYHTNGFSIPDEVEVFSGQYPESTWAINSPEPADRSNHGSSFSFTDDSIKAIRNRRDLKYHIKAIPKADILFRDEILKEPIFDDVPHHFIKRDLERIADMDVSAQYTEQFAIDRVQNPKAKRDVIEEEDVKNGSPGNIDLSKNVNEKIWIPQPSPEDEDLFDIKPDKVENKTENAPVAEALTEKQTGRGARGLTKDHWIKLPFLPPRLESDQLTQGGPNSDEINHRMPRVNFVTQGKGLQTAESRNQRESYPSRASSSRTSDIRTEIYPARDNRARSLDYTTYSRRSYYYPDDYNRRPYYDDYYDDYYSSRRYPSYDRYDYDRYDYKNSRNYNDYGRSRDPYDRFDSYEDSYSRGDRYDRPRRIIYYANLPDVVRSPPNVYRYPYSRNDDDKYYGRGYVYPSSRYPYSALKKAEDGSRDLSGSSSGNKENSDIKKRQDDLRKAKADAANRARDAGYKNPPYSNNIGSSLNSVDNNSNGQHQTLYHDITRMDSDLHRYEHPSFQAAVDDPYINRHD